MDTEIKTLASIIKPCKPRFVAAIMALSIGLAAQTCPAQLLFTEDFTTTTYRNAGETDAEWNTSIGELRMPPFAPVQVGNYLTEEVASGVAVAGELAYLVDEFGDLQVFNITDVTSPALLSTIPSGNGFYDIDVDGDRALVAAGTAGLIVFDISDSVAIPQLGFANTPGFAYGVDIDGATAYIADGTSGVAIMDISDAANPVLIAQYDTGGTAYDVVVDGGFAYIADGNAGLVVLDVALPGAPVLAWNLALAGTARGVWIAGDHIYVASGNGGLHIVDRAPTLPIGNLIATHAATGYLVSVSVVGNRAYVCDDADGLVVVDVTDPAVPVATGSLAVNGTARAVRVVGRYAFVAVEDEGLEIIQVATNIEPTPAAVIPTGGVQHQIVVRGDLAYVAGGDQGLQVFDNTDPANPVLVGSFDSSVGAVDITGVAVAGNYAFATDSFFGGLYTVDISDPSAPSVTGGINTLEQTTGVIVAGDYAYLTTNISSLIVANISTPASPVVVDVLGTGGGSGVMVKHGNVIYQVTQAATVDVIDVSDPASVSLLTTLVGPWGFTDLAVVGNYLYVTDVVDGLQTYLIQDPQAPVLLDSLEIGLVGPQGIAVDGNRLLLSRNDGSIAVVSIRFPGSPSLVSESLFTGHPGRVTIAGEFAYVTGDGTGMRTYQIAQSDVAKTANLAQSLDFIADGNPAIRARLTSQQTGDVSWELSVTGYSARISIPNDNTWVAVPQVGFPSLVWHAGLNWQYGTVSAVSDVQLEWLNEEAKIQAITDVGNDQGRRVRLEWLRSGHDFTGDSSQITEYAIYRRIDDNLPGKSAWLDKSTGPDLAGTSKAVQLNAQAMQATGWDFVTTVPVLVADQYAVLVTTLADSTIVEGPYFSTFKVVALTATPGVFFTSAADSGYSLDNLAPNVPTGINAAYSPVGVDLVWTNNQETDFRYYRVYRGNSADFAPVPGNLVQELTTTAWTDASTTPWAYHYKITAVDFAGNESPAGSVVTASEVPASGPALALHSAVPNPFNPSTRIDYTIATAGRVQLQVFDVSGRLIKTLVDKDHNAGTYQVVWQGLDRQGNQAPSGVYLYQLRAGGRVEQKRMTLLK